MKGLCIEVIHPVIKERSGSLEKKKGLNEFKQIGWIIINPSRYIINFVLNDFEENVNIIDLRKQKIGEACIKLSVNMHAVEDLYPNPT